MTMVANPEVAVGCKGFDRERKSSVFCSASPTFGRSTKAQFVKVSKGPSMTWVQRAKAGVDAKHFQAALAAKGGS
jgi:hypothetical protein